VIFVNNAVYGMTGGQMAPTTLIGQKTATTLKGRDLKRDGPPLKIAEMLSVLDGAKFIERTAVHSPKHVLRTKKAIRKAFQNQIGEKGFSFVEVLSMCPTYWGLTPIESVKWIDKTMLTQYPLGIIKE